MYFSHAPCSLPRHLTPPYYSFLRSTRFSVPFTPLAAPACYSIPKPFHATPAPHTPHRRTHTDAHTQTHTLLTTSSASTAHMLDIDPERTLCFHVSTVFALSPLSPRPPSASALLISRHQTRTRLSRVGVYLPISIFVHLRMHRVRCCAQRVLESYFTVTVARRVCRTRTIHFLTSCTIGP